MRLTRAVLLAAVSLVLAGCGQDGGRDEIVWKAQSLWQAGTLPHQIFEEFAKRVTERSGGRLKIEPLAVGSIVSSTESLDAVSAGILQAQHSGAVYFTGKDAAFALIVPEFEMPP